MHAWPQVRCLNEQEDGSAQNVFKAWEKRTQPTDHPLRSHEGDSELLVHVP